MKALFVGFTDGTIRAYSLEDQRVVMEMKRHTDIVLSLLWVPKYDALVSSSVDPQVLAWEVVTGYGRERVCAPLRVLPLTGVLVCVPLRAVVALFTTRLRAQARLYGNETGIRKVVYGPVNDVLVGAGFNFDGLVWDANTNKLLMKLVGHRATIVDIAILRTMWVPPRACTREGVAF